MLSEGLGYEYKKNIFISYCINCSTIINPDFRSKNDQRGNMLFINKLATMNIEATIYQL